MGGARINRDCKTSIDRLFVAGEDGGGVHGGNRLGGNGICESSVYGRQAGKALARFMADNGTTPPETDPEIVGELMAKYLAPFGRTGKEETFVLRAELKECNWNNVGVVRNAKDMAKAVEEINAIREEAKTLRISGTRTYNMPWNTYIDLLNMLDVSDMVVATAMARKESRAAHYRSDFPEQDDDKGLFKSFMTRNSDGKPSLITEPVDFMYKSLRECQTYTKQ
jgi:succinate dehydrogenase / fumarate reductase flavoprotein subunit/fumarate reductase flavoprotein subunit